MLKFCKLALVGLLFSVIACVPVKEQPLESLATLSEATVLKVTTTTGNGSGVLVGPDLVLTAYHVVNYPSKDEFRGPIIVHSNDMKLNAHAEIIAFDKHEDLALLRISEKAEVYASVAGRPSKRQEPVFAAGYPLGYSLAITGGYFNGYEIEADAMYASANVVPGNSGGPIFRYDEEDNRYEVTGVVLMVVSAGGVPLSHMGYFRGQERLVAFLDSAQNGEK